MNKHLLELFKGYYVNDVNLENIPNAKALAKGIYIDNGCDANIVDMAIEMYGKDGEKLNQTFHKSFSVVANASDEQLYIQQLLHYFTTYGFEALGIFDENYVYIPAEKLEIPNLTGQAKLIYIRPLTGIDVNEKIMQLAASGIALKDTTIQALLDLSDFINKNDVEKITNRELKIALYDKLGVVPSNPEEFLRYVIFKTTGETLKINNNSLICKIKNCDKKQALYLFKKYVDINKLSSIFLRNKNLFLAFKSSNKELNHYINVLRKRAVKYHKPLQKSILDRFYEKEFTVDELTPVLDKITTFKEVQILNGIRYRLKGCNEMLYRIRNGKSYAKINSKPYQISTSELFNNYQIIYDHLINRLSSTVKDKIIYIPNNITYMAPTSEKQFIGNIPNGSSVVLNKEDVIFGIHWENSEKGRVDLDLHLSDEQNVFGWDGSYRNNSRDLLFSGDVTDAPKPKGATEVYYIGRNCRGAYNISINNYSGDDVPFDFFVATADRAQINKNYTVNPNNIIVSTRLNTDKKGGGAQCNIGYITVGDNIKLSLYNYVNGNTRTFVNNEYNKIEHKYLEQYNDTQLELAGLFKQAGAIIVNTPTIQKEVINKDTKLLEQIEVPVDFDLSFENIDKTTIINLFSK